MHDNTRPFELRGRFGKDARTKLIHSLILCSCSLDSFARLSMVPNGVLTARQTLRESDRDVI